MVRSPYTSNRIVLAYINIETIVIPLCGSLVVVVVVVLIEIKLRHRWKQIHGGSTPRRLWINNIGLGSGKNV